MAAPKGGVLAFSLGQLLGVRSLGRSSFFAPSVTLSLSASLWDACSYVSTRDFHRRWLSGFEGTPPWGAMFSDSACLRLSGSYASGVGQFFGEETCTRLAP